MYRLRNVGLAETLQGPRSNHALARDQAQIVVEAQGVILWVNVSPHVVRYTTDTSSK
jgi:hypothetical protein